MGLLSLGTPLDWSSARKHNEHVRSSGIVQLRNIFKQHVARTDDHFFWGDEVEYMLVNIDQAAKRAKLAIDKDHILNDLSDPEKPDTFKKAIDNNISFHPEYGRYMIETTPLRPYDGTLLSDFVYVEENMKIRREVAQTELPPNILPLTLTSYPRMGCGDFTSPKAKPIGPASQSLFLPDEIINRHARFPTLTANIRKRRGRKVAINIPFYPDSATKLIDDTIPHRDLFPTDNEAFVGAAKPGHVYMDSMGFGMGSSCLQITMQASDIAQSRYLYDSLAPLTPIMLALTAAAPIFKGYLVNQDVRWNVISGSVDDRTFVEENVEPYTGYDLFGGLDVLDALKKHTKNLGGGKGVNGDRIANEYGDTYMSTQDGKPIQKLPKSRYDSIDSYLGDTCYTKKRPYFTKEYNDINPPINKNVYDDLIADENFDEQLARHFSHLFVRDPLVIFDERICQDNETDNDHFENLQLTNWQTLRFKPPALYPGGTLDVKTAQKPGWRVEFRPMEIQLHDFENAAFSVFITLASQAILEYAPDFYIPILKIEENMKTAHKVDAVLNDSFWFKNPKLWNIELDLFKGYDLSWFDRFINDGNDLLCKNEVYLNGYHKCSETTKSLPSEGEANEVKLTINEVINGCEAFPGLINMIIRYISYKLVPDSCVNSTKHCKDTEHASQLTSLQFYLRLISDRASGKLPTAANFIRDLVLSHPDYNKDSKVSESINFDIVNTAMAITKLDATRSNVLETFFGSSILTHLQRQTGEASL